MTAAQWVLDHKNNVEAILKDVECPPYKFTAHIFDWEAVCICAEWTRPDRATGEPTYAFTGGPYLPSVNTRDNLEVAVVGACLELAKDIAEHEVLEAFHWRGRRVFDPHIRSDAFQEALNG